MYKRRNDAGEALVAATLSPGSNPDGEMMGAQRGSGNDASPGVRGEARSSARQALARARDEQGQSLVEFGLLSSVLFPILLGIIVFGLGFNNYLVLTNGTNIAAQALAISRGQDTPGETVIDPCQTAYLAFHNAAPTLNASNLKFTVQLWTSATASTTYGPLAGGSTATCTAGAGNMTSGQQSLLTVTYPVQLNFLGFNFCPKAGCTVTSTLSEVVQ
jgi:Flp pilus assembly protein TadG